MTLKRLEEIRARLALDDSKQTREEMAYLLALVERQAKALEVADAALSEWKLDGMLCAEALNARAEIAELMKVGE